MGAAAILLGDGLFGLNAIDLPPRTAEVSARSARLALSRTSYGTIDLA